MKAFLLSVLLVASVSARAVDRGYEGEIGVDVWGGLSFPGMYDVRHIVDSANDARLDDDWEGGKDSRDLGRGLAAGVELYYGFAPDIRVVLAGGTAGSSWNAKYTGIASNTVTDAYGTVRYQEYDAKFSFSEVGVEAGGTFLLRRFEQGVRVGLVLRGGWHRLYGESFHYTEEGPLPGWEQWGSFNDANTFGGLAGLEWEWLFGIGESPSAVGLYLLTGYRLLSFSGLEYTWHDDTGSKGTEKWNKSEDEPITVDFSGPELRFGLRYAFKLGE